MKHAQITKQFHPHHRVGRVKTNKETNKQIKKKAKIPPEHQSPHQPTAGTENLPLLTESLAMPKTVSATSRKGYHTWQKKKKEKQQNTSEQRQQHSHKPGKWITELGSKNKFSPLVNWGCCIANSTLKKSRGK